MNMELTMNLDIGGVPVAQIEVEIYPKRDDAFKDGDASDVRVLGLDMKWHTVEGEERKLILAKLTDEQRYEFEYLMEVN